MSDLFAISAPVRARSCETSRAAAASVSASAMQQSQARVLYLLRAYGPLHDEALLEYVHGYSPSRIRTARNELVARGLVQWSGAFARTRTGRAARVWTVCK